MIRKLMHDDRYGRLFLALLAAMTLYVALANQWLPAEHPMHVSTYTVTLLGKYLTYALLAITVDLVWGLSRHTKPRAWRIFCAGWICHGHVFDAPDW